MKDREFDFDEPIIICLHNFDLSDRMAFATELANRFGININLTKGADNIIDSVNIPNATFTKNLYCQNSKFENDFSYVLEYGDEAHIFYKNHLQYVLPFISDFNDFADTENIYEGIKELKSFGTNKIYIGNLNELNLSSDIKFDWTKLSEAILNGKHHIIQL